MGVDTKLFIATKEENIIKVMPKVINGLNKWIREKLDKYCEEQGYSSRMNYLFGNGGNTDEKLYSNGIRDIITHDFMCFNVLFKVDGENRKLFVTHTCSCDYNDTHKGDKIIFSLGYWGLSKEIMMVVADSIKEFGDVYFMENDSTEDFVKI